MSRCVKRVLIDQAELDRMQQRQLRDYSPELHSMANMQRETRQVLDRKDIGFDEKLKLLCAIDKRFDQLRRETNTLSSKTTLKVAGVVGDQADPVIDQAADDDAPEADGAPDEAAANDAAPEANVEPVIEDVVQGPIDLSKINLHPTVKAKAEKLLQTITDNPQILSRNAAGELVLYGEPVHGSDFDAIFSAAFTANKVPNMPGTDSFFKGLRTLHVRKTALSSRHFVKAFGETPKHVGPARRGALALGDSATPVVKRPRVLKPILKQSQNENVEHDVPMSPPIKPLSKQTGKGRQIMSPPPGRQPTVLYVYGSKRPRYH